MKFLAAVHALCNRWNLTTFNPDYPTCSYTHAWLRVMHEQLDLDEISRLLGVEPTSTQKAGDLASATSGRVRRYSGWFLESAGHVESRDSRGHFAWLLDRIAGKEKAISALTARGYPVDICCRWDSASGHGGPNMDPAQMVQLGSLGIDVWFDIYFDRLEPEDA